MAEFTLQEAQLFRLLTSFFGSDQVIPHMSVLTICGGSFREITKEAVKTRRWAKRNRCLFTIVNHSDEPKLVVDFSASQGGVIDMEQLERERVLPELLSAAGIRYITISANEFCELMDGDGTVALCAVLEKKIGVSSSQ